MKVYTIGYGGRRPDEFAELLKAKAIQAIVDVRLRPDRSSMGSFARARTPDKGIEHLLAGADIQYFSFVELGNLFGELPDWADRYRKLLELAGDLLTQRLQQVPGPFCLMCAEKSPGDCHRRLIADFLVAKGHHIEHIE
jgi:uncharacterized protein (DUF488 family)